MKMPEIRRRRTWLEIRGGDLVSDAGMMERTLHSILCRLLPASYCCVSTRFQDEERGAALTLSSAILALRPIPVTPCDSLLPRARQQPTCPPPPPLPFFSPSPPTDSQKKLTVLMSQSASPSSSHSSFVLSQTTPLLSSSNLTSPRRSSVSSRFS